MPPAPPTPPEPPLPDYQPPPIWQEFVPAEESGLPPATEEPNPFGEMLSDLGYSQDPYAATQLWYGWFDMDITSDQRVAARQQFFDYTGMGKEDFTWEQWKEWYGETAA